MLNIIGYTNKYKDFVDAILAKSLDNLWQSVSYPRGGLEDIEAEIKGYGLTLEDSLYILNHDERDIGMLGLMITKEKSAYLLGPIFLEDLHLENHMNTAIALAMELVADKDLKKVMASPLRENVLLREALKQKGFHHASSRIAMYCNLNQYEAKRNTDCGFIQDVSIDDKETLASINDLLARSLDNWQHEFLGRLYDNLEDDYHIEVLTKDGEPAGSIIWYWMEDLHFGEISYIAVDSKFRNLGYGTQLIHHVLEKLSKDIVPGKPNLVHLDVLEKNQTAFRFYVKNQFSVSYFYDMYDRILDKTSPERKENIF